MSAICTKGTRTLPSCFSCKAYACWQNSEYPTLIKTSNHPTCPRECVRLALKISNLKLPKFPMKSQWINISKVSTVVNDHGQQGFFAWRAQIYVVFPVDLWRVQNMAKHLHQLMYHPPPLPPFSPSRSTCQDVQFPSTSHVMWPFFYSVAASMNNAQGHQELLVLHCCLAQ